MKEQIRCCLCKEKKEKLERIDKKFYICAVCKEKLKKF